MKFNLIEVCEITDFEKTICREIIVTERGESSIGCQRYFSEFENSEIMEQGLLVGAYGDGNTIDESLKNLATLVSNKTIAFDAYSSKRKNISFPKLVHTKLLNK
jgi:hypothetical protein